MNTLPNELLPEILMYFATSMLLVCKKWREVIMSLPQDIIQRQVQSLLDDNTNRMHTPMITIADIPASLYRSMNIDQQIAIPNRISVATCRLHISTYKYPMKWARVYRHISCNYTNSDTIVQSDIGPYALQLFKNYEQFRRYMFNKFPIESSSAIHNKLRCGSMHQAAEHLWSYYETDSKYACIIMFIIRVSIDTGCW